MSADERQFFERMARQVGNSADALVILAGSIDTPLADAICAISDLLERISADITIATEAAN